jgi:hypothetical protein
MMTNTLKNSYIYIYIYIYIYKGLEYHLETSNFKQTPSLDSHLCNHWTLKIPQAYLVTSYKWVQMGVVHFLKS